MFIKISENEIICPQGAFIIVLDRQEEDVDLYIYSLQHSPQNLSGLVYEWNGDKALEVWMKFVVLANTVKDTSI